MFYGGFDSDLLIVLNASTVKHNRFDPPRINNLKTRFSSLNYCKQFFESLPMRTVCVLIQRNYKITTAISTSADINKTKTQLSTFTQEETTSDFQANYMKFARCEMDGMFLFLKKKKKQTNKKR